MIIKKTRLFGVGNLTTSFASPLWDTLNQQRRTIE